MSVLVPARIAALVALGQRADLDRLGIQDIPAILQERDELMRVHWRDWDVVTETMSLDDLVAVIKALTIIERLFRWSGGSVSSVIWTLRDLSERDHTLGQQVAAWVLEWTENGYVTDAARWATLTPLEQLAELGRKRDAIKAQERREKELQEQAQARRDARIAGELERQKAKAEEAAIRNTEIAELGALPASERLTRIAESTHHLHYWPDEFAQASSTELDKLDDGIRAKLLEHTATSNRRCWKQLGVACVEGESTA